MIFFCLFYLFLRCDDIINKNEESNISLEEYQNRAVSLLVPVIIGSTKIYRIRNPVVEKKFFGIAKIIYNHFEGNIIKLAAFTSAFLENFSFNQNLILLTLEYEKDIQNKFYLKTLSKRVENKKLGGKFIYNRNLTLLENELAFFDKFVKDYSFENIFRLFVPISCNKKTFDIKSQGLEYAYYIIKIGRNGVFFGDTNNFKFLNMTFFILNHYDKKDKNNELGYHTQY